MRCVLWRLQRCCAIGLAGSLLAGALVVFHSAGLRAAEPQSDLPRHTINRICFMFHPVCWRMHGEKPPAGADPDNWAACYNRELRVNELQKQFISRLPENAALVLFPIGNGAAMRALEEHATKTLGRRCVIVRRPGKDPPRSWARLADPIGEFLANPALEGRAEFLSSIPDKIQSELVTELSQVSKAERQGWNVSVLEVLYYSRMCALDIENAFAKRNLVYDPAVVRSEAFGEGFEQCAMTWKQMLVPYLGLAHPAENNFDLSVSGAPFLVDAVLKQRIRLSHDLRLYLWEAVDGRKVAMYCRAWCRLKDPQLYARVALDDLSLVVREVHDKECWPQPDDSTLGLQVAAGHLRVPVFNGIRRDFDWRKAVQTDEEACYLIADNISLQDFRKRLLDARIGR